MLEILSNTPGEGLNLEKKGGENRAFAENYTEKNAFALKILFYLR